MSVSLGMFEGDERRKVTKLAPSVTQSGTLIFGPFRGREARELNLESNKVTQHTHARDSLLER